MNDDIDGLASLLGCMAFCLILITWFWVRAPRHRKPGLPGQIPARPHPNPLDVDFHDGRYHCPRCPAHMHVSFDKPGDLLVHEIQDHPTTTWRP
jgi:hypothetical protein